MKSQMDIKLNIEGKDEIYRELQKMTWKAENISSLLGKPTPARLLWIETGVVMILALELLQTWKWW